MTLLLSADDPPPFQLLRAGARSPFVLTCDHAGRLLPRALGDLGLPQSELVRHIAWDLGIAEVARKLSARLEAFAILQTYSRLVIDCNRPPGTPESIVGTSERTVIPGNADLTSVDIEQRRLEIFEPYQSRIAQELATRHGLPTVLVALHSFTPRFMDVDRSWQAGILYGADARVARPLLAKLREEGLTVGDNEPYAVSEQTDYTVMTHGEQRGTPYVEVEIRQDLIADAPGQQAWAERLALGLEHVLASVALD